MEELILQKIQEVNEGLQEVLTYLRSHPQQVTNIGTYFAYNLPTDSPTPPTHDTPPPPHTTSPTTDDIGICQYIVVSKIKDNTNYSINILFTVKHPILLTIFILHDDLLMRVTHPFYHSTRFYLIATIVLLLLFLFLPQKVDNVRS